MFKTAGSRNIAVLHIIRFLSSLYFYHQIATLLYQSRGLNYLQINSLWGIIVASKALAEIPSGVVADRIGRKRSIIIALALQFAGELWFIFAHSYLEYALICVVAGIGFAFLSGCFEAMMYDSLKAAGRESQMQKVAGLNGSFALLATMIGTTVGGVITASLTPASYIRAMVPTATCVFLAGLASFGLKEPDVAYGHSEESAGAILKQGLSTIRGNRSLQRLILLSLLATPFINYLLNFIPPTLVRAGVAGHWFGIILATASLAGALLSRYAYKLEELAGVHTGTLIAVIAPGLAYFLLATVSQPAPSVLLVILAFGSMHIQGPIFSDYLNRHIESRHRATVLSLIGGASGIYVALLGLVIGAIGDISLTYAFVTMGILITTSALFIRITEEHTSTPG